ncbi:MAG: FAD-dependent oxidoreductase [Clostridia bacterium]
MRHVDLIIIGGGPAGMAAAVRARELGLEDILLIERDAFLGGILKQCIHNGFGLHIFREELTGPEYAGRYIDRIHALDIEYKLDTMVLHVGRDMNVVTCSKKEGMLTYRAKAVILAMGCRERPRGALMIPGTNPSGIFTAGTVQRFVNIEGMLPGKTAVILGSGDIGLIMARRLTLEGVKVKMVCEIMGYPGGLTRNIVQCLDDYNIPLKLSHTVTRIHGRERIDGVTVSRVDGQFRPVEGTEEYVPCDTLLLSVGLIPENELTRGAGGEMDETTQGARVDQGLMTSIPGMFSCGNVLHVHDLVDYVSLEGVRAAEGAHAYLAGKRTSPVNPVVTRAGRGIRYVLPQVLDMDAGERKVTLFFRSLDKYKDPKVRAGSIEKKYPRLAPSEMETITLDLDRERGSKEILVEVLEHD